MENFNLASVILSLAEPNNSEYAERAKESLNFSSGFIGPNTPQNAIHIPWSAFAQTTSDASEVVRQNVGGNVMPLVEASQLLRRANVYNNLVGNFQVPVFSPGAAVFKGVAEGSEPTAVDFTLSGPKLTPKTAVVRTTVTELALLQSGGQLEAGLSRMFRALAVQVIEQALVNGGGTNEPTGILNVSGTNTFNVEDVADTMTYQHFTQMIAATQVAGKIAPDTSVSNGVWFVSPGVMAVMKGKTKVQTANWGEMLLEEVDKQHFLDGYLVIPSNAVPNEVITLDTPVANDDIVKVAFLDARELHVGFWGDVRMSVDTFTNPLTPVFTFYFYYDAALAHPESVSVLNYQGK